MGVGWGDKEGPTKDVPYFGPQLQKAISRSGGLLGSRQGGPRGIWEFPQLKAIPENQAQLRHDKETNTIVVSEQAGLDCSKYSKPR